MAEGTIYTGTDNLYSLHQGQANIRHDIAKAACDTGHEVSRIGHDLSHEVGNTRRELASESADIRYNVAERAGDIRREVAHGHGDIKQAVAEEACKINDNVKTSGWQVADRVGTEADRIVAQDTAYFIASQNNQFSTATALAALKASTDAAFANTQVQIQLAQERNAAAIALAQAGTNEKLVADGNTTRALINQLKMDDLNRELIERNAALVECKTGCNSWQQQANNLQQANLASQMNALLSQVQETRQGMVNFGSMIGVGQSSTSNNVR